MPTTITKSIGTTGRDYTTWQTWEDAMTADLVAADEQWVGQGYNDSEFTSSTTLLTISGHTTDTTRNIICTTGSAQSFRDHANKATNPLRYNASVGVGLRVTGNGYYRTPIVIEDPNVVIRGLQIKNDGNQGSNRGVSTNGTSEISEIDSCIVQVNQGARIVSAVGNGSRIINSLLITEATTGNGARFDYTGSSSLIAGCTIVRPSGITASDNGLSASASMQVKNTAIFNFTDFCNTTITGDYNASDDATNIPGGNSNGALTYSEQFENNGSSTPDFRAKSVAAGGDLKFGTPDATNTPDDIIGTTRDATTPWVGCWEVLVAAQDLLAAANFVSFRRNVIVIPS